MDDNTIEKIMRDTQPRWLEDGFGLRGPQRPTPVPRGDTPQNVSPEGRWPLRVQLSQSELPEDAPQVIEQTTQEVAASTNEGYQFQFLFDSIDGDIGSQTVDILILDGEVNGTFPSGMTGADDYTVTLTTAGSEVYVVQTYNTSTLVFDTPTIAFGASVPDSTFGTLYVPLGFVDWDYDPDTGAIINVVPRNRQCGDINIALVFGAYNAARAVFALHQYSDPVAT